MFKVLSSTYGTSGGETIPGSYKKVRLSPVLGGTGGGVRTGHDRDQNEGIDFGQVTRIHGLDF